MSTFSFNEILDSILEKIDYEMEKNYFCFLLEKIL